MIKTLNPHLPSGRCRLIIADKNMFSLENLNFEIIESKESVKILKGINSHPDMQVCHLKGKDIVVCDEFYQYYKSKLSPYGFNVIKGENEINCEYPDDIAFNCLILGNTLYHKLSHTDRAILKYAEENNFKLVDVKQGYTKCSSMVVNENSVITSDKGLFKVFEKEGVDVIYIKNNNILLPGFDCGFIGGCGGKISTDEIYFSGNIEQLDEYNIIVDFLDKKDIKAIYIKERKLTDYGSFIPLLHN